MIIVQSSIMPFLSSSSPFDEIIEKATNEKNTTENWDVVLEVCDRVKEGGSREAKDCLLSLKKRLNHKDPHVVQLALSVVDSCVSNCGEFFHSEIASQEFVNELKSKATGGNRIIGEKTRMLIKRWAVEESPSSSKLLPISVLYNSLKDDGHEFTSSTKTKRSEAAICSDESQREEQELAKAIELSMKEQEKGSRHPQTQTTTSLYTVSTASQPPPLRVVKALYDFEAAEDNELTFTAGELITVQDDSDVNWWHGSNHRGEGLFPASFVTADLTAQVEQLEPVKKKSVQFDEKVEVKTVEAPVLPAKIDEEKLNECLELLEDADPTGDRCDSDDLLKVEEECKAMGPLIDAEIQNIDGQHNQLASVNVQLMEALNLYHTAMKEAAASVQLQTKLQQFTIGGSANPQTMSPGASMMYQSPQQPGVPYASMPHQSIPPTNLQTVVGQGMNQPAHASTVVSQCAHYSQQVAYQGTTTPAQIPHGQYAMSSEAMSPQQQQVMHLKQQLAAGASMEQQTLQNSSSLQQVTPYGQQGQTHNVIQAQHPT